MFIVNSKGEYVNENTANVDDWGSYTEKYILPTIGAEKYSIVAQYGMTSKDAYDKLLMESMLYSYWGRRLSMQKGIEMSGKEIGEKIPRN